MSAPVRNEEYKFLLMSRSVGLSKSVDELGATNKELPTKTLLRLTKLCMFPKSVKNVLDCFHWDTCPAQSSIA